MQKTNFGDNHKTKIEAYLTALITIRKEFFQFKKRMQNFFAP